MFKIIQDPQNAKVFNIIAKMPINTRTGMRQGLYQFGRLLYDSTREDIKRKPKSGKEYFIRKGNRRFRHIASAPGETPASNTGNLRRAVAFSVYGSNELEFGYNDSVDYGKYLEDGTKNIEARPGLLNNINKNQLSGIQIISNEINKRL